MHKCKFCNKEFEKHFQLGSHIRNCRARPDYLEIIEKRKIIVHQKNEIKKEAKYGKLIEKNVICSNCNSIFKITERELKSKEKYFCSRKCANSHIQTKEQNLSRSFKLKGRSFPRESIQIPFKSWICNYCGNEYLSQYEKTNCRASICKSKHLSSKLKGKTGGWRSRSGKSRKHIYKYKEIWLDSSWELKFVHLLDEMKINWIRNSTQKFPYIREDGVQRNYYPDFYLPDRDLYVEIKGFWTSQVRHKMKDAQERNHFNLIVLDSIKKIEEFI